MRKFHMVFFTGLFIFISAGAANAYYTIGEGWDGPGLNASALTWSIGSYSSDMSSSQQYHIVELALADWATYANVSFTFTSSLGAENQLDFYLGANLSQTQGYWGYSYYPKDLNSGPIAGDIFIDDGLTAPLWTAGAEGMAEYTHDSAHNTWVSADLYYVIHHEIGHALGLQHPGAYNDNLAEGAVMSPFFGWDNDGDVGFLAFDTLQADDIAGIQSLYAAPVPIPAAIWLLSSGLLCLMGFRKKLHK